MAVDQVAIEENCQLRIVEDLIALMGLHSRHIGNSKVARDSENNIALP